jgi:nucleoside-diphosphate-sugar epimerase
MLEAVLPISDRQKVRRNVDRTEMLLRSMNYFWKDDRPLTIHIVLRLMRSRFAGPVNIGSDEMISNDGLVDLVASVAGKTVNIRHIDGPLGVRGRNSDNMLIREKLEWVPELPLRNGIEKTYPGVERQVRGNI